MNESTYTDEQTARYYDLHAKSVAANWEAFGRCDQLFPVAFPDRARLLDIGCGSGRDLARLLHHGHDAYGVEPSAALRDLSVRLHPELEGRVYAGALPAPMPDFGQSMDGVICSAVLQHLIAPQYWQAVCTIKSVLRPFGRALVVVSSHRSGLDASCRDEFGRLHTPLYGDELTLLFARAGFQRLQQWSEPDSRGRGFEWLSLLFQLQPP